MADWLTPFARRVRHMLGAPPAGDDTDEELLQRFATQREEAAFAEVVRRHGPLVRGVCRRVLRDEHEAEDAFQATFLVLAAQAHRVRHHRALAGWLHRVAFHTALRARGRAARRRAVERQAADREESMLPESAIADLLPLLDRELQRLPEKYRTPLVLCYLQGRTHADAAAALGWPRGSLAKRLERGCELLRERLGARDLAPVLAALSLAGAGGTVAADAVAHGAAAYVAGTAGDHSSEVIALTTEVLQAMRISRWMNLMPLVLTVGLLSGGIGALLFQARADRPEEVAPPAPLRPVAERAKPRPAYRGSAVAFAANGTQVAVLKENAIRLYDWQTGKELRTFKRYADQPKPKGDGLMDVAGRAWPPRVAFAANDKHLIGEWTDGSPFRRTHVWDLATGKELRVTEAQQKWDNHSGTALSPGSKHLAFSCDEEDLAILISTRRLTNEIRLKRLGSDDPALRLVGHASEVPSLTFSADGRVLASADVEGTVRLWEVATGQERRQFDVPAEPAALPEADLVALWDDLAVLDGTHAARAIAVLASRPADALPFLRDRLARPAVAVVPAIATWVRELESADFAVRQRAGEQLEKAGGLALDALRRRLAEKPALDAQRRIEQLLVRQAAWNGHSPDSLRTLRGIEALETIGGADARKALEALAGQLKGPAAEAAVAAAKRLK